ncbi:MAG: ABC transporter permease [Lachnospiraceae bacterium]|nr:ABC transporter permease [Lachnospiraceae bacterium]
MRENIWKNIKLGFKTNKLAIAGAVMILLLALISIFAFLYPVDPNALSATERLQLPTTLHPFGTDDMGRDYLARCIYGGRASLLVGFLAMILSTVLGIVIGSISGFVGGAVDAVLMRIVDALMSLPTFLIMIVMNAYLKPGIQNIVLIIGCLTWMNIARIVRGETISLNEREYVIYAKISGQKTTATILKHILPNIMPTIIVAATMNIANAILMESALSFFGLGIQPPTASWGSMLSNSQRYIQQAPYLALFPGLLILLTVISFNYLGEVLRNVFEPK